MAATSLAYTSFGSLSRICRAPKVLMPKYADVGKCDEPFPLTLACDARGIRAASSRSVDFLGGRTGAVMGSNRELEEARNATTGVKISRSIAKSANDDARFVHETQTGYAIRPNCPSRGTSPAVTPTTANAATPPSTTARTAPRRRAATPLSNAPSSFDDPMNTEFTTDTRPSKPGGEFRIHRIVERARCDDPMNTEFTAETRPSMSGGVSS